MKVLINEQAIQTRIKELGQELSTFYQDKPLTVVVALNGGMIFAADLVRQIKSPLQIDSIGVSSYQNDDSCGELTFRSSLKLSPQGRHILIVDDILDTGCTMKGLLEYFANKGALSVKCCVLLDKNLGTPKYTNADWVGFVIPNQYAIGYGLDSNEEFRNLPVVAAKD